MKNLPRLRQQLQRHEGFRSKPYRCSADKLTIGYGRNLEDKGVSESEASEMLSNDIEDALLDARKLAGFHRLNGPRQSALVNMVFNMGLGRVQGFRKMLAALAAEDYGRAADEMLDSRWAAQVGNRAIELSEQMESGKWRDA